MNSKTIIGGVLGVTLFVGSVVAYEEHENNKELTTENTSLHSKLKNNEKVINDLVKVNNEYEVLLEKKDTHIKKMKSTSDKQKKQIYDLERTVELYDTKLKQQEVVTAKVSNTTSESNQTENKTTKLTKSSNQVIGGQTFNVTFYSSAFASTGRNPGDKYYGVTASGTKATLGRTIACPPQYAFGTKINIEGFGTRVCEDRGGAIKGNHLDVYVSSEEEAYRLGRQFLKGKVVN